MLILIQILHNMKKKFLLFLIAALPALAFATNGTWQGTGTVNDPYRIAGLADLKALIPDDGNSNYQDKKTGRVGVI